MSDFSLKDSRGEIGKVWKMMPGNMVDSKNTFISVSRLLPSLSKSWSSFHFFAASCLFFTCTCHPGDLFFVLMNSFALSVNILEIPHWKLGHLACTSIMVFTGTWTGLSDLHLQIRKDTCLTVPNCWELCYG